MKQRFITSGVNEKLSLQMQLIVWSLVDLIPCEKDYLIVFNLKPCNVNLEKRQIIDVSQEIPPYEKSYSFCCHDAITAKLYWIADTEHITLLLASEY